MVRTPLRSLLALVVAAAVVTLGATGCTEQSLVVEGSTVTVAVSQSFTSANDHTSFGNTPANAAIAYATSSRFNYYNDVPRLVKDESVGSYEVVGEDPFSVRYTIASGATWSDGAPIDAADLLLAWAANSGRFNTADFDASKYVDAETGQFATDFPDGTVYFDGATRSGLQNVTLLPQISDDGRSITLVYDTYFPDWELAFQLGMPAHVVGLHALPISAKDGENEVELAKASVIEAIQTADTSALAAMAVAWNSAFNFDAFPKDPSLLVSSGPYTVTAMEQGRSITLSANPLYRGEHLPQVETIVVRTITDPLESVAALDDGSVDIATPSVTSDVVTALDALNAVTVVHGVNGTFEHLDLQFDHSKSRLFGDPLVREAFLSVVPRQHILDELIVPLQPDAQLRSSHVFMPGAAGYDDSVATNGSAKFDAVNVDSAKALLAEAGVTNPEVCILFDPSNPRRAGEFLLIQESAKLAGFSVTDCSSADWVNLLGVSGAYDAALFGWNSSNLAVSAAKARLRSDSAISNLNYYSNPEVDSALDALDATRDQEKQNGLLAGIDAALWADAYGVPLFQHPAVAAFSDAVTNVSLAPLAPGVFWNLWEWQPTVQSKSSASSR